ARPSTPPGSPTPWLREAVSSQAPPCRRNLRRLAAVCAEPADSLAERTLFRDESRLQDSPAHRPPEDRGRIRRNLRPGDSSRLPLRQLILDCAGKHYFATTSLLLRQITQRCDR